MKSCSPKSGRSGRTSVRTIAKPREDGARDEVRAGRPSCASPGRCRPRSRTRRWSGPRGPAASTGPRGGARRSRSWPSAGPSCATRGRPCRRRTARRFAFAWSRSVARSGRRPTYQKTSEIVAYVETAKTSQMSGLRKLGHVPSVPGIGRSQWGSQGRPEVEDRVHPRAGDGEDRHRLREPVDRVPPALPEEEEDRGDERARRGRCRSTRRSR